MQSDPVVVMDRIKKRGRPEESTISLEFLEGLNRLHEDWLIHRNTTTDAHIPSKKWVLKISYTYEDNLHVEWYTTIYFTNIYF